MERLICHWCGTPRDRALADPICRICGTRLAPAWSLNSVIAALRWWAGALVEPLRRR